MSAACSIARGCGLGALYAAFLSLALLPGLTRWCLRAQNCVINASARFEAFADRARRAPCSQMAGGSPLVGRLVRHRLPHCACACGDDGNESRRHLAREDPGPDQDRLTSTRSSAAVFFRKKPVGLLPRLASAAWRGRWVNRRGAAFGTPPLGFGPRWHGLSL